MAASENGRLFCTDVYQNRFWETTASEFIKSLETDEEIVGLSASHNSQPRIYDKVTRMIKEGKIDGPVGFVFQASTPTFILERIIGFFDSMQEHLRTMREPIDISGFGFEIDTLEYEMDNTIPVDGEHITQKRKILFPVLWVKPKQ